MNPYLTKRGRWLFVCGALCLVVGALAHQPVLVGLAMVPLGLLIRGAWTVLNGSWVADQRRVSCRIEEPGGGETSGVLRVGQRRAVTCWLSNHSEVDLRISAWSPRVEGSLEVEVQEVGERGLKIDGQQAKGVVMEMLARGVGRGSIQGVDIAVGDALGLLESGDYIDCIEVVECRPSASSSRRAERLGGGGSRRESEARWSRAGADGMDFRELRDYQPGDSLRSIAWKATMRQQRLISRDYEIEEGRREAIAIDISTSMKVGAVGESKFDQAVEIAHRWSQAWLDEGREVGLWSFDHDIYGGVEWGRGRQQLKRIGRHLVELRYPVDRERTALDDEALVAATADYLRVQERLNFREASGNVDEALLDRWLRAVERRERRRGPGAEAGYGVYGERPNRVRRFWRHRGMAPAPPSELRAGAKEWGLVEVIKRGALGRRSADRLSVISDLCGVRDVEPLRQPIRVARSRGIEVRWLVPFSPDYRSLKWVEGMREGLIADLFRGEEATARREVAHQLEALDTEVIWWGPQISWRRNV